MPVKMKKRTIPSATPIISIKSIENEGRKISWYNMSDGIDTRKEMNKIRIDFSIIFFQNFFGLKGYCVRRLISIRIGDNE